MFAKVFSKRPSAGLIAGIIGISGCINLALWFLALTKFPQDDVAAVLHYNIATGIDLIGEGTQITVLPAAGLILLVGNSFLGATLVRASSAAAWVVWSVLPLLQLTLLSAFLLIWQAN